MGFKNAVSIRRTETPLMIIFSASRRRDTTGTTLNDEVQASDLDLTQQYRATIEFCEGALGIDESSYLAYQVLGRVHQAQGRLQEAIHAGERVVQISGDVPVERGLLATYYGLAGRHKEARQILEELQELGKTRYVPATKIAKGAPCLWPPGYRRSAIPYSAMYAGCRATAQDYLLTTSDRACCGGLTFSKCGITLCLNAGRESIPLDTR